MNFKYPILSISLSSICIIIGLILGIQWEPIWFARFGALVVLFAVMAEYSLVQIEMANIYKNVEKYSGVWNDTPWDIKPSLKQTVTSRLAHTLVVFGTLIWGFGDWLLFFAEANA